MSVTIGFFLFLKTISSITVPICLCEHRHRSLVAAPKRCCSLSKRSSQVPLLTPDRVTVACLRSAMLLFMAAASDITFVLTTIGDEAISFINWAAG